MTVLAIQAINNLPNSNARLVIGEDRLLYVVKFPLTAGESRLKANEMLASRLARLANLPIPQCQTIAIPTLLIKHTPSLGWSPIERSAPPFTEYFGSLHVGTMRRLAVFDYLPEAYLTNIGNENAFAGMFAFDRWCANSTPRRAIFYRGKGDPVYSATFINFSGSFSHCSWRFNDCSSSPAFPSKIVYRNVTGWKSFEPFLSRLVELHPDEIWKIAKETPKAWYNNDGASLEKLVDILVLRRNKICELILQAGRSDASLFPGWLRSSYPSRAREFTVGAARIKGRLADT